MLPNLYDLSFAEERCRELRRQASLYRQFQANRIPVAPGPNLTDRIRTLMARLRLVRPVGGRANAAV